MTTKLAGKSEKISQVAVIWQNVVLSIIPNHFGKHVNRTSQINIVIYKKNITLLENNKLLSKQKDVAAIFNKHFGSIAGSLNLFSWLEDTSMSSGINAINFIY